MPGGLLYRLFGVGKLPENIRQEIAGERVLFEAAGIHVVKSFKGRVPGLVSSGSKNLSVGSFVVTDKRVIGARGNARLVDVAYELQAGGPVTLTLDASGMHVEWDLDRVHPACHGTMKLHFKETIPDSALVQFPVKEITFNVDPAQVVRLAGSRRKLPDPAG